MNIWVYLVKFFKIPSKANGDNAGYGHDCGDGDEKVEDVVDDDDYDDDNDGDGKPILWFYICGRNC